MADGSALARGQLEVFEASAAREAERLDAQLDAAPKLSRGVRWAAVYAAVWVVVQVVVAAVGLRRWTVVAVIHAALSVRLLHLS